MTYYECYADESVLKFLGFTSSELKGGHSFGRSRVSAKLKKETRSLGVIDEDPGSAKDSYLNYLFHLKPIYLDEYLRVVVDAKTQNKLVVIRPNLEAWSVRLAQEKRIDLKSHYNLENDWRKLHDVLRIEKNEIKRHKFIQFISDIFDHKAITTLRQFIR
jgi:hypothetical protein